MTTNAYVGKRSREGSTIYIKKRLIFDFGFDFETILVVQETVII